MKSLLKFILVSVLTFSMFGLTSCDLTGKEKRKQEAKDMALRLLEEKYGEKFEISDAYYDSGLIAYFSPVEHPEVIFEATISLTDEMLYGDDYPRSIIATRIQQECEKVLNELGIDYYVRPYIFSYKINETTCPYTDITSREYIDALHNEDINVLIDEMDILYYVFISADNDYDVKMLYDYMIKVISQANVNAGAFEYAIICDEDLAEVKKRYSKFSLNSSGTGVMMKCSVGAGITDFNTVNKRYEDFYAEFEEMQNKYKESFQ